MDGYAEHDWFNFEIVDGGLFLSHDAMAMDNYRREVVIEHFKDYGLVKDDRLVELRNGAAWSDQEVAVWQEHVAEAAFDEEAYFDNADTVRVWAVIEVKHSQRGCCFIGVLDWDTIDRRFVAAYSTRVEVLNALRSLGCLTQKEVLPDTSPDDPYYWAYVLEQRRQRKPK